MIKSDKNELLVMVYKKLIDELQKENKELKEQIKQLKIGE